MAVLSALIAICTMNLQINGQRSRSPGQHIAVYRSWLIVFKNRFKIDSHRTCTSRYHLYCTLLEVNKKLGWCCLRYDEIIDGGKTGLKRNNNNNNNEWICKVQNKLSSAALHRRAGVESFQLLRKCLNRAGRQSSSKLLVDCYKWLRPKLQSFWRRWQSYVRFYELGLTRELTNPRVGVIPSLFSD